MSPAAQPPNANLNMHDRVVAEMRRRIISGELAAGVNLSEIALAESFGVSRTPVREALKRLQTEGLITIRPRVGTFVTTPSRREITELFEIEQQEPALAVHVGSPSNAVAHAAAVDNVATTD